MVKYPYTVERDESGKFVVQFLDFPEGFTSGDTEAEAAANAVEVLGLLVNDYLAVGIPIPEPSTVGSNAAASVLEV